MFLVHCPGKIEESTTIEEKQEKEELKWQITSIHSPLWSLTVKASVFASRMCMPSQNPEATFKPSRNFLLLIQLELSVNVSSPNVPTPSLSVTCRSPVNKGLLPSRSFTTWLSNSSWVQSSSSSLLKSPSSTTTSSLTEASGPDVTTMPVLASIKTTWIVAPCSPSTFPPVKRGRDSLDLKCSCKFRPSGPSIRFGEDLKPKAWRIYHNHRCKTKSLCKQNNEKIGDHWS